MKFTELDCMEKMGEHSRIGAVEWQDGDSARFELGDRPGGTLPRPCVVIGQRLRDSDFWQVACKLNSQGFLVARRITGYPDQYLGNPFRERPWPSCHRNVQRFPPPSADHNQDPPGVKRSQLFKLPAGLAPKGVLLNG